MNYLSGNSLVILVCIVWTVISATAAIKNKSWIWFLAALGLSFVGILFPVAVFLLSSFLVPDWKGACSFGWGSCFHMGKLALSPLVLWACAALYALDIYRTKRPFQRWIVLGIWTGALVSTGCFAYGVLDGLERAVDIEGGVRIRDYYPALLWMLVPLYTACWFSFRAWRLFNQSGLPRWAFGVQTLATLPFWIGGMLWSRKIYADLPDAAPSCFVVTAASRGHEQVVGAHRVVMHRGEPRQANVQLATFWAFEDLWRAKAPRSHGAFRCIYNRIGPVLAQKLNAPWKADVAYLAIKPFEIGARWALSNTRSSGSFRVAQNRPGPMLGATGNRTRE